MMKTGITGDGCIWTLDENGLLTIRSSETMEKPAHPYTSWGTNVKSVVIENGVTTIDCYAFWNCKGLTSVTIPESVTTIDYGAFAECTSLTSVTIGNNVTTIRESAFWNCKGLTSVTIPESVTNIESHAFGYCTSLRNVIISDGMTNIDENAFIGCTSLTSFIVRNRFNTDERNLFMKKWLKIVRDLAFSVALDELTDLFYIPVDFTVGENAGRSKHHNYEERYFDNDNDSVAEKAIKSIANGVGSKSFDSNIVSAANNIYQIAKQHKDDENTIRTAINELNSLIKKVNFLSNKETISKFIKELAIL